MRLLISKAPQWRKFRTAGETRIFFHDHGGLFGGNQKDVGREGLVSHEGIELALGSGEVKAPVRLMDEHGPPPRADEPRDRNTAAVCCQLISTLPALHPIERTTAVELRATFAQAQQRRVPHAKGESASLPIDLDPLDQPTLGSRN